MSQKPETRFRQGKVIPFLKTLRHTWYEPIQQKAINGSPDFVLCIRGRFIALELKSPGGKVSPLQEKKLADVVRVGGVSIVAEPKNWDEVKIILSTMDASKETAWK